MNRVSLENSALGTIYNPPFFFFFLLNDTAASISMVKFNEISFSRCFIFLFFISLYPCFFFVPVNRFDFTVLIKLI